MKTKMHSKTLNVWGHDFAPNDSENVVLMAKEFLEINRILHE